MIEIESLTVPYSDSDDPLKRELQKLRAQVAILEKQIKRLSEQMDQVLDQFCGGENDRACKSTQVEKG
ncbi:MAG TPA: hypothetical protein VKS79_21525 [Gemmataceae bacterium]|nr:hypothetical protein [Gemmataceae bacterium]